MRLAIHVQRGSLGILAEADGAVLVGHSGKRNAVSQEQISGKQSFMAIIPMDAAFGLLLHEVLEFGG